MASTPPNENTQTSEIDSPPQNENTQTSDDKENWLKEHWVNYRIADVCFARLCLISGFPLPNKRNSSFPSNKLDKLITNPEFSNAHIKQRDPFSNASDIKPKTESQDRMELNHRHTGMLLTGATNNGKTSILLHFKMLVENYSKRKTLFNPSRDTVKSFNPVIYVETPPYRIPGFLKSILEELNHAHKTSANVNDLTSNVIWALKESCVRVLILDEFQNVLEGSKANLPLLMHKLIYISNRARVRLVLAGLPDIEQTIGSTNPLRNRLYPMHIPEWKNDVEFQSLLKIMTESRGLSCNPPIETPEVSDHIYSLTEGLIGEVANLLTEVVKQEGGDLTLASFDKVSWIRPSERRSGRFMG